MRANDVRPMVLGFVGAAAFWSLAHAGPAVAQSAKEFMVRLQPTTPGTPQSGHVNVTGTVVAGHLSGDGSAVTGVDAAKLGGQVSSAYGQVGATNNWSGVNNFNNASNSFTGSGNLLTGLNASALASGTVPEDRLSVGGDVTGPLGANKVTSLIGQPVIAAPPIAGQVLRYNGLGWRAAPDSIELPFLGTMDSFNVMFQMKNDSGPGIVGWSVGGNCGVAGASGSIAVARTGTGVSAYSIASGGYGLYAEGGVNAKAAGGFHRGSIDAEIASAKGALWTDGFVWREYVTGAPSVGIPVAYGTVNAAGTIAGGTGNFTATRTAAGTYSVQVTGETYSNSNYSVSVTPVSSSPKTFGIVNPGGGPFLLRFWDAAGNLSDTQFQFTAFTPDPVSQG